MRRYRGEDVNTVTSVTWRRCPGSRKRRWPQGRGRHLLLGVLAEEKGIAAQVLGDAGVTLQAARAETFRLLGTAVPDVERDTEDEVAQRLLAKASELVGALVAQPPPHAARVHEIGTEFKAVMDELRDLV